MQIYMVNFSSENCDINIKYLVHTYTQNELKHPCTSFEQCSDTLFVPNTHVLMKYWWNIRENSV